MPENETLMHGGTTASRWRPIKDRIDGGLSPTKAFPEIHDLFYSWFQNGWRQCRKCGVDTATLFNAALTDTGKLRNLLRQTRSSWIAQLLLYVATDQENPNRECLLGDFVDAAWDWVQSELQLDCREEPLSPEFLSQKREMLDRIRESLVKNPSRFPSRKHKLPPPDMDTRLGENLL